jgi:predicted TIM-barrel fold metal-dependent hydrolase
MFIDAHLHTARRKGLPRNLKGSNYATPTELIAMMDRTGVDKGILLPGENPECTYQTTTNEDILEVCEQYPDRFYPFCNVDPRAGNNSPDTDLSFHLNYYKKRGCRGVGEICANMEFDDPLMRNLFKHCERCEMPALFHIAPKRYGCYGIIDALGLPGLTAALQDFPNLIFIGHSQPFWAEISGDLTNENRNTYPKGPVTPGGVLPKLMEEYPNLYCGWDAGSGYNALTRDPEFGWSFMERFKDRILFGTDICDPTNDHRHAEYLRKSHADGRISDDAFENISWRNANRLLKLGL